MKARKFNFKVLADQLLAAEKARYKGRSKLLGYWYTLARRDVKAGDVVIHKSNGGVVPFYGSLNGLRQQWERDEGAVRIALKDAKKGEKAYCMLFKPDMLPAFWGPDDLELYT